MTRGDCVWLCCFFHCSKGVCAREQVQADAWCRTCAVSRSPGRGHWRGAAVAERRGAIFFSQKWLPGLAVVHSIRFFFSQLFESGSLSSFTFGIPSTMSGLKLKRVRQTNNQISIKYILICLPVWGETAYLKNKMLKGTLLSGYSGIRILPCKINFWPIFWLQNPEIFMFTFWQTFF